MGSNVPLIELRGVCFRYPGGNPIHDKLDFVLQTGGRVGVMGQNGAGKTSLFHLIVGLLQPDSGEIRVMGRPRCQERDFWEVRQKIGLLFQDPDDQLFCPTVGEDVAFGPLNLGKSRQQVMQIVQRTLEALDLAHLQDRVTHHLSGGEKRLVSLATVLAMEPDALLLDEPTAGLAEGMVERLIGILNEHVQTCAIISHNRHFLERCTDVMVQLHGGKVVPF